ncbi:MAG: TetR/AcrR family transcriptional regulator [Eubacteriales bacterium]
MAQYQSGRRTKKNIYYASEKLFYEKGYENTTITNITDYANANRGSFYHHYENKMQLGVQVYSNFAYRNSRITSLFGNTIDRGIGVCLSVKTFWYLFFHDENIRRFSIDLSNENILQIKEDPFIYNACLQLTKKKFTAKQMKFISITNIGLSRQLNIDAYTHTDEYDYNDVSDYYMSTMFRLFDIRQDTIKHILLKSKELFLRCDVTNEGFYITCRLKNL